MSQMHEQIIVDITIAAPITSVWTALREPAQIGSWFGWEAPALAEEIAFIFGSVVADEAQGRLDFGDWEGVSHVVVLSAAGERTGLRVVRSSSSPIDWAGHYDDITEGWITFFQQLRLALERHQGQQRRTLYLSGPSRPDSGAPRAELGLGEITGLAPDAAYAAVLGPGDSVRGQVWHQSSFQTGLTVEQWGDGLLVVSDMGIAPNRPQGGGSVLLTTYGLSDADFAALEQRWTAWWTARYPTPAS